MLVVFAAGAEAGAAFAGSGPRWAAFVVRVAAARRFVPFGTVVVIGSSSQ